MTRLAEVVAAKAAAGATTLVTGTVTAAADGRVVVTVGGVEPGRVLWADHCVVEPGDTVAVLLSRAVSGQSSALVVCRYGPGPRSATGRVVSVAGALCVVDVAEGVVSCAYVGTPPAAGDTVRLVYQGRTPIVVGVLWRPPPAPPVASPAPPAGAAEAGTTRFPATQMGTYLGSGYYRAGSAKGVVQGSGWGSRDNCGVWWYGDAPRALAGRTLTAGRLTLTGRSAAGAPAAPLQVRFGCHSHTTPQGRPTRAIDWQPVITVPAAGGGWPVVIDLPTAVVGQVVAGGGVFIDGPSYGGFTAAPLSGCIDIDWSR